MIDGGASPVGVESTIVSCLGAHPVMLRPGGVPRAALEARIGRRIPDEAAVKDRPLAPGMLASHYAPKAAVRLDARTIGAGEAVLLFGDFAPEGLERAAARLNLSERGDLVEAAANLFGFLRRLDGVGAGMIAVAPVPAEGLGEAILDRLRRAAAPRA